MSVVYNGNKPYYRYWGKAKPGNDDIQPYHLLVYHCLDVAAVGYRLLTKHDSLRLRLSDSLGLSEDILTGWMIFFLAVHDIGKFSEAFQRLLPSLHQKLQGEQGFRDYSLRHDSLGFIVWKELWKKFSLHEIFGLAPKSRALHIFNQWVQIVTGHHGEPPRLSSGTRGFYIEDFFAKNDIEAAYLFVGKLADLLLPEPETLNPYLENKSFAKQLEYTSWWLAGISVVCDWIGSDASVFEYKYEDIALDNYWNECALPGAEHGLEKSGILPARKKKYINIRHLFDDLIIELTPLQDFCHSHYLPAQPQLWILEDVTGSGKTEAALALVHRMMSAEQADGVFIGLPTMATANAMYERMEKCYRSLFDDQVDDQNKQQPSLILAHGARHLSKRFRQSILPHDNKDRNYGTGESSASAQCVAWLADHQKKSLLADVGIGTVDQALLGILPAKHQSMRLLGLACKILVVDEVHAYDSYMHQLLQVLLRFHAKIGGSAILLSATLPRNMREQLAKAYSKGLGIHETSGLKKQGYPLITQVTENGVEEFSVDTRQEVARKVPVRMLHDEESVVELISKVVNDGRCVCWIRNTVADARAAYRTLGGLGEFPDENILLFHSRYTLLDRLNIEQDVLKIFGKNSDAEQRSGKILIATQVAEQSLDLDFDEMISDLAPVDLMIQRAGRFRRHIRDKRGNPEHSKNAKDKRPESEFHIFGPVPVSDPTADWYKSFFPKTTKIYPHTGQLWLTARLLARLGEIDMPCGARDLIEGVYGEVEIPEALEDDSFAAEGESMAKRGVADWNGLPLDGGYCRDSGIWDDEIRMPTRLGEETKTVYLAHYEDNMLKPWADGEFPWDLSSVRINARRLSDISGNTPNELKKLLESFEAHVLCTKTPESPTK